MGHKLRVLIDKTNLRRMVLIRSEAMLGLPEYEVTAVEEKCGQWFGSIFCNF
jgi:hypothetical protein